MNQKNHHSYCLVFALRSRWASVAGEMGQRAAGCLGLRKQLGHWTKGARFSRQSPKLVLVDDEVMV